MTPHQVAPNDTEGLMKDNELTSLKYGIYNLGFAAVRNDEDRQVDSRDWWARSSISPAMMKSKAACLRIRNGAILFPALFDGVFIERDPGYNVASWNISRRG